MPQDRSGSQFLPELESKQSIKKHIKGPGSLSKIIGQYQQTLDLKKE